MKELREGYSELLVLMRSRGITQKEFAEKLGISTVSLYHRLQGRYPFTQDEISVAKEMLGLSPKQLSDIFFAR